MDGICIGLKATETRNIVVHRTTARRAHGKTNVSRTASRLQKKYHRTASRHIYMKVIQLLQPPQTNHPRDYIAPLLLPLLPLSQIVASRIPCFLTVYALLLFAYSTHNMSSISISGDYIFLNQHADAAPLPKMQCETVPTLLCLPCLLPAVCCLLPAACLLANVSSWWLMNMKPSR